MLETHQTLLKPETPICLLTTHNMFSFDIIIIMCALFFSGNAYRYTIQPNFQDLKSKFQCHIHHKKHKILYKLFFYVKVPGTDFETKRMHRTVFSHDLNFHSRGEYKLDYITVEHFLGLNMKEEFVLAGNTGHGSNPKKNFTIYPLKQPKDYGNEKVDVHKISDTIVVARTQFDRPFAYSTSTWVDENQCAKNTSVFRKEQKHYDPTRGTHVNVEVKRGLNGQPHKYLLKSLDSPPYIRFLVPGKNLDTVHP